MEQPGIPAIDIDRHYREAGIIYQLDDTGVPRFVLNNMPLLPSGNFPGREQTERTSVSDMVQRLPDSCYAFMSSLGKIINRDEGFFQV